MAAGLGFKNFNTGEVLTSADVNGYLMQGVLVFASEAARNAAITSPQEGQFAYTKDNNSLWYYTGSVWAASGATGDIEGVTAGTGISGGGTSGTVTITNSMATEIDAKGDLIVGTGADTFARLAVGTNGHTLVANSSETTGLEWVAPAAGGGKTLLSTTNLTSTGVSIAVSQSFKDLEIWVYDISLTGQAGPSFKDNNLPGTYYSFLREGAASSGAGRTDIYLPGSGDLNTGADAANFVIYVYNYTSTEYKMFNWTGHLRAFSDNTDRSIFGGGWMGSTAALTDLSIFTTGGPTFDGGAVKVYGVN